MRLSALSCPPCPPGLRKCLKSIAGGEKPVQLARNFTVTNILQTLPPRRIDPINRSDVSPSGASVTHVQPEDPATIPARSALASGRVGSRIVALDCYDVRFPTSLEHDGSDAMNPDPDSSAAYAVLRTDADDLQGNALCFTIGRGNEVMVTAVAALRQHVVGRHVAALITDLRRAI